MGNHLFRNGGWIFPQTFLLLLLISIVDLLFPRPRRLPRPLDDLGGVKGACLDDHDGVESWGEVEVGAEVEVGGGRDQGRGHPWHRGA